MKKILLLPLFLTFVLALAGCKGNGISFILVGDAEQNYTVKDDYIEQGFLAHDDKTDISSYVTISGDVDPSKSGDYTVTYALDYNGTKETLTRVVHYREDGCKVLEGTDITECDTYWSQYLSTIVKLRIYYQGDQYNDAVKNIFNTVEYTLLNYHKLSDKYNTYDGVFNVKSINLDPATTHVLDPELYDMIKFALSHQSDVDNLFNIALGPVLSIWHQYREDCNTVLQTPTCVVPPMADLQAADQYTNPNDIILNDADHSITMKANMSIDLGGVSKGYISGKIIDYLNSLGLYGYLLNNGNSNISVGGTHPTRDNGKFLLAITDPTYETDYYATVFIGDGDQLVTSGDYQQYYTVDGQIYHHIINPNTLMPERYSRSVSIITSDPALADLYSTAIFTMPLDEGLAFVNSHDNMEAIWYKLDNTVQMSANFESLYLDQLYLH